MSQSGSVVRQVEMALQAIFTDGVSRAELKARGLAGQRIVSHRTMTDYQADCCRFAKWCKLAYGIQYLREITPAMAEEYVQGYIDLDRSGGHIGKVKAAIRKLDVAMRKRRWRKRSAPDLLAAGGGWHSDRRPERAYTPEQAARIVAFMRERARDKQTADVAQLQRVVGLGLDDREARREVAEGLGHNRINVTYAYIPRG